MTTEEGISPPNSLWRRKRFTLYFSVHSLFVFCFHSLKKTTQQTKPFPSTIPPITTLYNEALDIWCVVLVDKKTKDTVPHDVPVGVGLDGRATTFVEEADKIFIVHKEVSSTVTFREVT